MDEYIKRSDAVQCARDVANDFKNDGLSAEAGGADTVGDWLQDFPTADVRRVDKCKWKNLVRCGFASVEATCSACGKTLIYKSWWHFCPNCGARVGKEQEDK